MFESNYLSYTYIILFVNAGNWITQQNKNKIFVIYEISRRNKRVPCIRICFFFNVFMLV